MPDVAWQFLYRASSLSLRRNVQVTVEGLEQLPANGPAILAPRHYHHLYDGAALLATCGRPTRILVGLDWIEQPLLRWTMERLCRSADWPMVQRRRQEPSAGLGDARALVHAIDQSVEILRRGEILVIFPEGYPTIDPTWTPKTSDDDLLPFLPGFVHIARRARKAGLDVPVIPVGLEYRKHDTWDLTMRFGAPVSITEQDDTAQMLERLEREVRALSGLAEMFRIPTIMSRDRTAHERTRMLLRATTD